MSSEPLDPTLYVRQPVVDLRGAVALSVALLSAVPPQSPPNVKDSALRLRTCVLALQSAWAESERVEKAPLKRPVDLAADTSWKALDGRLASYARLPAERYPKALRAQVLRDTLFPAGLSFLRLDYKLQWAEAEKILQRIEQETLAPEIDDLAGPEFLSEVRLAHTAYGAVLGITSPAPETLQVKLQDPLREVTRAIANYGLQVVAAANADPGWLVAARAALRPIDEARAAAARRTAARASKTPLPPEPDQEGSPDTPVPPLPA
jgi:hypothetical protein